MFEGGKVVQHKRSRFSETVHIGAEIIDPDAFGVPAIGLAASEEHDIRLDADGVEDTGWQPQDGVELAEVHGPSTQPATNTILEQYIVRHDDRCPAARLQGADDVFDKGELLVRGIRRDREIRPCWAASALFSAERRIGQDHVSPAETLTVR
jgi:hypothetical protein